MKRWIFLKIIAFVSGAFLLLQLMLWTKFASKEIGEPVKNSAKELVKTLLTSWDSKAAPLILIEPQILSDISHTGYKGDRDDDRCSSLCQSQKNVLTFAVIGDVNKSLRHILKHLWQHSFTGVDSVDNYPEPVNKLPVRVTTHIFLQHMKLLSPTVHIVVFYKRSAGFLWHSKIQIAATDLEFGFQEGSFSPFDTELVQIDGINILVPRNAHKFLSEIDHSKYIECDTSQAKDFVSKYKQDTSDKAKHFQRKARQLISQGKQVLDRLGVPFWISSGTLLGWFRQCDIIPHAQDVDFGMFIKNYKPQIIEEFKEAGLPLKHIFGKENDSFELSFQAGDIKLDIFFFYEEKDHMWNGGTEVKDGQKFKYTFPKFGLCWASLLDLHVRVPCPTLPYIEANYGKDWSRPVTIWDWKASPPNVKPNGYWPKQEWDNVMQIYDLT